MASEVANLVELLKVEESRDQARTALIALGRGVTPFLLGHMKDPDFGLRWELANIQGYLQDPVAIPALVEDVLHDSNPHVRWRSMWALTEYPDHAPAIRLLREAMASSDRDAHWNGAVGLSMMLQPECLPVIHEGVTDPDPWRRFEAINALRRVHDARSVDALRPAVAAADVGERGEAVLSLGEIGGTEAATLLLGALEDPLPDVRWRAVLALSGLRDPRIAPALRALRTHEHDELVREQLEKALGPGAPGPGVPEPHSPR